MRSIILHYHLFKNAGTSVDSLLEKAFGDLWQNFDNENPSARYSPKEFEKIIIGNPELRAFSSHQIVPPLPVGGFKVFPIVFLRHPIDRIRSAYLFEWKKQLKLSSPKGSLKEYVEEKFKNYRGNAIEEFHVMTLANKGYEGRRPSAKLSDEELLNNAKSFIDEVPFYGVVELFKESLIRLDFYLKMEFPEFKPFMVDKNITQDRSKSIEERMKELKEDLGGELYDEVLERNKLDMKLYEYALKKFDSVV